MAKCQVAFALIAVNMVIMAMAFEPATSSPLGFAPAYQPQFPQEMANNEQRINNDFLTLLGRLPFARQQAVDKRNHPHLVQSRSLKQYKNCYFSPVQCVLLELRRRR